VPYLDLKIQVLHCRMKYTDYNARILKEYKMIWGQGNIVSIVTKLLGWTIWVSIPIRDKSDFCHLQNVQTGCGAYPAPYSVGPEVHSMGL